MPSSLSPTIQSYDDLDFFKDFENEFPAIAYNDNPTSKLDHLIEPSIIRRKDDLEVFIWLLGLHIDEENSNVWFGAIGWVVREVIPDKWDLRGQAPEKVTSVDLFYLRSMDRGTANVPYLLAQYLFRHAEGRKNGARLSGGHFIGCLAAHFGLVNDQGLRGLLVVTYELSLIDLHERGRLNICVRVGDTLSLVAPRPRKATDARLTMQQGFTGSRRRYRSYDGALWGCKEMLTDRSLIRDATWRPCCKEIDDMVEFRRVSLTGFRSCASRSQNGASQSRQSTYSEARIYTRIEPVDLEFIDSVSQCFQNPCQRAVTKLVDLVESHDLPLIVVDREYDCSRRLNDGIIMLELVSYSIPS
ncbi:hypothetical protein Tco_0891918 [Tanacetum coccineum]|uniref:Uncharacterized protein n=1 Tax=Tanacetum coccineum TaxID=301880 RepID=A0ABQ5C4C6_9ASTR